MGLSYFLHTLHIMDNLTYTNEMSLCLTFDVYSYTYAWKQWLEDFIYSLSFSLLRSYLSLSLLSLPFCYFLYL